MRNIFVIVLTLSVLSCSGSTVNTVFQKKYGKEVKKIKVARTPPGITEDRDIRRNFAAPRAYNPDHDSKVKTNSDYEQYYANVDAQEYGETQPKMFFPNEDVYVEGKNAPSLPKDMFDVPYYTRLSPPFRRSGLEFDAINIPARDRYGVVTAMSEKEYLLVGNKSLQKNIDEMNSDRSSQDIEMSEILIKEQRMLRRKKKMIKVFGHDSLELQVSRDDDIIFEESDKDKYANKETLEQDSKKVLEEVSMMVNDEASLNN